MIPSIFLKFVRAWAAILCLVAMVSGSVTLAHAQASPGSVVPPDQTVQKIPAEQIQSLVAPIALYPDNLLAQVLAASTYPLEIIQLKQWMDQNKSMKPEQLAEAAQKQQWDPSVQALCVFPDVVKQLADNIKWTTDLGNAFLAQQGDVMIAIQTLRKSATDSGKLKSTEQMTVKQDTDNGQTVVVIQPANPEVVYVPSYNPVAYWPPYPAYPYYPMAYPPYYPGQALLGFGIGLAVGAIWGGAWGWGCGWGNNSININNQNNFIKNDNRRNNVNNGNRGNNNWSHRAEHRGGAPYGDRRTADKFGGNTVGDRRGNNVGGRGGVGGPGGRGGAGNNFGNGVGSGGGNFGGGGANSIGNRGLPSGGASASNRSAFGGSSFNGGGARASSSRGASSFGGGSRGGGGFSGGGRGGGGGGRRR